MSRSVMFPAMLCSAAEQVYFTALDRGWGAEDDGGIVRLWTPDAVTSIPSDRLSASEKTEKLNHVLNLLTGIHLVAAAEAVALAHHVGIPLPQFYELACDAAGGSTMFKDAGKHMIDVLDGRGDGTGAVLSGYIEALRLAVDEAQKIKSPLFLGTAALNVLLQTRKQPSIKALLDCYLG